MAKYVKFVETQSLKLFAEGKMFAGKVSKGMKKVFCMKHLYRRAFFVVIKSGKLLFDDAALA